MNTNALKKLYKPYRKSEKFIKLRPTQKWLKDNGLEYKANKLSLRTRPYTSSVRSLGMQSHKDQTFMEHSSLEITVTE